VSKLHKRIRRRLFGAKVEFRIYEDGSSRVRVDHPSNDPGLEIEITGRILREAIPTFRALGLDPMRIGPLTWRDDP
jgi:hypothetical protein